MKTIVTYLVAALTLIVCAASPAAESDPSKAIRRFYQSYVAELIASRQPMKADSKMKQFITPRLLKQIARMEKDGLDYDYFTQAQDFDDLWAKNIAVSNLHVRGTKANADVILKGATADMVRPLKLEFELEGTDWKIDRVARRD